ncbi:hypothetical protein BJ170DRAFT_465796 [Xylariales sp. AK1849]|nr:hypothetical protein BJ170DRAFT_465796 [Xylariales sp. AK1849]
MDLVPEQTTGEMPEPFSHSPSSLLHLSPDSSQQSEMNFTFKSHSLESGVQLETIQDGHSRRPFSQQSSRSSAIDRSERQHRNDLHDAPQRLSTMSSLASTLLPGYSEPRSYTSHQLSPVASKNSICLNNQPRVDTSAHMVDLDQQEGFALTPVGGGPDCSSGLGGNLQNSYDMSAKTQRGP